MREQYWILYASIRHRLVYYQLFQKMFTRINWILSALCTLVSLSCIAAWGIWGTHPVLWSIIICSAQVYQALFPKLPYNDLLVSTKFMICALDKLFLDIEHTWLEMNYVCDVSDADILSLITKYESAHSDLVSQFFAGTFLPQIGYLERKTQKACETYFSTKYSVDKEVNSSGK